MADALVKYLGKTITGIYVALVTSPPVAAGRFCGRCDTTRIAWQGQRPEAAFGLGTGSGSCGCEQDTPWSQVRHCQAVKAELRICSLDCALMWN